MVIKQMALRVVVVFCMICLMTVVPTIAMAQEQNESSVLAFTALTADDETDNEDEACTHETCTFYAYISTEEYIQLDVQQFVRLQNFGKGCVYAYNEGS